MPQEGGSRGVLPGGPATGGIGPLFRGPFGLCWLMWLSGNYTVTMLLPQRALRGRYGSAIAMQQVLQYHIQPIDCE